MYCARAIQVDVRRKSFICGTIMQNIVMRLQAFFFQFYARLIQILAQNLNLFSIVNR
jgi:predicted nucleic acid-binding Zn ribbon protein